MSEPETPVFFSAEPKPYDPMVDIMALHKWAENRNHHTLPKLQTLANRSLLRTARDQHAESYIVENLDKLLRACYGIVDSFSRMPVSERPKDVVDAIDRVEALYVWAKKTAETAPENPEVARQLSLLERKLPKQASFSTDNSLRTLYPKKKPIAPADTGEFDPDDKFKGLRR